MSQHSQPLFFGGQRRIMCRASTQTPDTTRSVPLEAEESLLEMVAVSAAFLGCVVILMFLG